ncbi:MAG: tetratricopeptide repeat protein [Chloroflexi bacterium]|nr:tetratricopeptide repeat protein [Chloroflexota bacterium]
MSNKRSLVLGWGVMFFVVALIACAGGLFMLKVLPPIDADRIMRRLPASARQAINSVLFPHPDQLPTPAAPIVNVASLLTPAASRAPTRRPTWTPTATPTSAPSMVPSVAPSLSPSIEPTMTPTPIGSVAIPTVHAPGPTQAARSTPAANEGIDVLLTAARQEYQGWNNCGPATLSMNLSFFGWKGNQYEAAKFLKPDQEDKNVSPDEMAAYARAAGFQAVHRVNGTPDLLKALLRAGLPVLVEKGFEPEADLGWMGHYELIVGFNDLKQEFIAMDSYLGPYQAVPYGDLDRYWRQFNRTYLIIYPESQAGTVAQLLGDQLDDAVMWADALAVAQAEAAAVPDDPFAWFNLGTNYVALNDLASAAAAYDRARQIGLPWRMTWYQFGLFDAYLAVGRYEDVLALADATLKVTPNIEEMYYYKGLALKAQGNISGARSQLELALKRNANFEPARAALASL